jgi:hypothetical protein
VPSGDGASVRTRENERPPDSGRPAEAASGPCPRARAQPAARSSSNLIAPLPFAHDTVKSIHSPGLGLVETLRSCGSRLRPRALQGLRGRLDLRPRPAAQPVQGGGLRGRLDLRPRPPAQRVQGRGLRGRLDQHPRPEAQRVQGGGLRGRLDLHPRPAAQSVQGGGLRGRLDLRPRPGAQQVQGGGLRGRLDLRPRPAAVLLRPVRRGGHVRARPAQVLQGGVRRPGLAST